MNISSEREGTKLTININGRIDTTNSGEFESAVEDLLKKETADIVLDCTDLNYISSSGLRVFLIVQKRMMAAGGKLTLKSMQPAIREIFDISGFSTIFTIE